MGGSPRQEISKKTLTLSDISDNMDVTDTHRTFHPKGTEYIFFSSAHGTVSRIDTFHQKSSPINLRGLKAYYLFQP